MSKVIKGVVVMFIVAMALLFSFAFLMGVSKMDVSLKHQLDRHVVIEPFEAGDIIALSPDGQSIQSYLCDLELPQEKTSERNINATYYNVMDVSQENFFNFVASTKRVFGAEATATVAPRESPGLPFTGKVSRVIGNLEGQIPDKCFCDVVLAVIQSKQTACVVEKSLVETKIVQTETGLETRNTVGLSLNKRPLTFVNDEAMQIACPKLNKEAIPPANQSCDGNSGFSFDAIARAKIGLVREAPLTEASTLTD